MPKFRLSNVVLDEISLVASGDDPGAEVVIAKAAPVKAHVFKAGEDGACVTCGKPKISKCHSITKQNQKGAGMGSAIRDWFERVMKENPPPESDDHVPDDAELEEIVNGKSDDEEDGADTVDDDASEEDDNVEPEVTKADLPTEVVQYIDALEAKVTELTKAAGKQKTPEQVVLEKADPEIRALIEKQQAQIEEAQTIAKAERDARLEREYLAKAETMRMVNENPAEFAKLLRTLADKAPEEAAEVEKLFRAADAQIAKGNLFTEFGAGGAETTISKSVEGMAQELIKADPTLTPQQAIARVYEQNPALYEEAMKEG